MASRNNQDVGAENTRRLTEYLAGVGADVPRRPNGDADITAIVERAGLSARRVIYSVDRNRDILNAHLRAHGIPEIGTKERTGFDRPGAAPSDERERIMQRQIHDLQSTVHGLRGEVIELRRQMRRYKAIEIHLADTGRLPR